MKKLMEVDMLHPPTVHGVLQVLRDPCLHLTSSVEAFNTS